MKFSDMSFSQKVGLGFGSILFALILTTSISVYALLNVIKGKDEIIEYPAHELINAERLNQLLLKRVSDSRGFLLTRENSILEQLAADREEFTALLNSMLALAVDPEDRAQLERIRASSSAYRVACDRIFTLRKTDAPLAEILALFKKDLTPLYDQARKDVNVFVKAQEKSLVESKKLSTDAAQNSIKAVTFLSLLSVLFGTLFSYFMIRLLGKQIRSAVEIANEIAEGRREGLHFPIESKNEVGRLLSAMRVMLASIVKGEQHIMQQNRLQMGISCPWKSAGMT